jgi:hypothetical protein
MKTSLPYLENISVTYFIEFEVGIIDVSALADNPVVKGRGSTW